VKRTDYTIYIRAIAMLFRRPSILVAPLLGAVVSLVLDQIDTYLTGPLGGAASGLFSFFANVFFSFAFAIAIIQADELERGLRGTFDSAWEDARRKAGGIIIAAIGFWFLIFVAGYIGSIFGSLALQIALIIAAAFFLIYTIPAAAIGGLPGQFALGGSIRAVRDDVFGSAVLAVAFIALFLVLAPYVAAKLQATFSLSHVVAMLIQAAIEAIALGYLAFPFAKQYAGIAFTRR
jgi:hypothetical protein